MQRSQFFKEELFQEIRKEVAFQKLEEKVTFNSKGLDDETIPYLTSHNGG